MTPRIVCHFSCGAASAVATKLAIADFGHKRITIYNAFIKEENADNRRFLADCEKWFDHPVTVLADTKYGASVHEVWRRERYMNGPFGASCSTRLKREVIEAHCLATDRHVFGFTVDEANPDRVKRAQNTGAILPLIDRNLTHADCLGMVERAGLLLPLRYRQGYSNANCEGCCKGGQRYWQKTRIDSPDVFIEVSKIQASIGPGAFFFRNRETGERWPLSVLPEPKGPITEVQTPECSFFCAMAEEEIA